MANHDQNSIIAIESIQAHGKKMRLRNSVPQLLILEGINASDIARLRAHGVVTVYVKFLSWNEMASHLLTLLLIIGCYRNSFVG